MTAIAEPVFLLGRQNVPPAHGLTRLSSASEIEAAVRTLGAKQSLWVATSSALLKFLLRPLIPCLQPRGRLLLLSARKPEGLPALRACFSFVYEQDGFRFLPREQILAVLGDENRSDFIIGGNIVGGSVDVEDGAVTLVRGDLTPIVVPLPMFKTTAQGVAPDPQDFEVIDHGHAIRLGDFEATTDAILYELDPDYRRRIKEKRAQEDQSLGASLRRLRKQRQLRQEDFLPDVPRRTIARIESGKSEQPHRRTLEAIAKRLGVSVEEIGQY